ncbi:type II toxin-antitoxin system Phd/YefM family antitoxin [Actinokineospora iranica]|uniref:Prevent-host-death family protein n=1 Tax=Actinokineospora iranica TaxID=1271860 RepID=A0A1G6UZ63_9PSEU|nr:type II toxin-antitoxin system prevent-host-death family antitoxin [Actinokineospora iranica]SDD46563.1 prevent-host-death family protein [Actinokineospora iranica]
MEQIPVRVLNQDTAGALERVLNGESLEITSRGKPIARLVPVGTSDVDDLVAAGRAIPAAVRGPFQVPRGEVDQSASASAALLAMRDEERW